MNLTLGQLEDRFPKNTHIRTKVETLTFGFSRNLIEEVFKDNKELREDLLLLLKHRSILDITEETSTHHVIENIKGIERAQDRNVQMYKPKTKRGTHLAKATHFMNKNQLVSLDENDYFISLASIQQPPTNSIIRKIQKTTGIGVFYYTGSFPIKHLEALKDAKVENNMLTIQGLDIRLRMVSC